MTPEAKQLLIDKPELCKEIAEDYCSFWCSTLDGSFEQWAKEHTKSDWEILSFKDEYDRIFNKGYDDRYWVEDNGSYTYDFALEEVQRGLASIHSIRRSDGEVFEVGDKVEYGEENRKGFISEFKFGEVYEDTLFFVIDKWMHCELHNITKLKPLFKTEDGIDIVHRDTKTYMVDMEFEILGPAYYAGSNTSHKYFSTREAAEAWVESKKVKPAWERLRRLI